MENSFDKIRYQVMWDRLIAVVEEQSRTLVRTAFSTSAREAGDVSAGVFTPAGEMIAQAVTGTPGHVNCMARSVKHFLEEIPAHTMREGDAYITNDPWKGTGHLFDITVVSPAFHEGRLVALFACTTHVVDVGGNGPSPESRDVFAEGVFIPILPLCSEGRMNDWLMKFIRANVREPDQIEGDIYALAACNDVGGARLSKMMQEYGLHDLDALARHIFAVSDRSIVEAIRRLPQGTWTQSMRIDGFEAPVDIVGTLTVEGDEIRVDYAGTSGLSRYGINCPMCYTDAYTSFGVKCVVAPAIPNNAAVLDRIKVTAPVGTITNAPMPCAVNARAVIGHMLPDIVFGCFDQAIPFSTPAESTGALWSMRLGAGHGISGNAGDGFTTFMVHTFQSGGMGARPDSDGLAATPFPPGVKSVPVEITETITPLVVWRKELRQDSGGAGRQRGGLGQVMEIGNREPYPFGIFARFERVDFPPRGRHGAQDGAAGVISLAKAGSRLRSKGLQVIPKDDRLLVEFPGGGGLGPASERDPERVRADVLNGYVSREQAKAVYKVVLSDELALDEAATASLRSA